MWSGFILHSTAALATTNKLLLIRQKTTVFTTSYHRIKNPNDTVRKIIPSFRIMKG